MKTCSSTIKWICLILVFSVLLLCSSFDKHCLARGRWNCTTKHDMFIFKTPSILLDMTMKSSYHNWMEIEQVFFRGDSDSNLITYLASRRKQQHFGQVLFFRPMASFECASIRTLLTVCFWLGFSGIIVGTSISSSVFGVYWCCKATFALSKHLSLWWQDADVNLAWNGTSFFLIAFWWYRCKS